MSTTTGEIATAIRPFHVEVSEEQIGDLRRRIAATRWPSKELVGDRSQGVQLAAAERLRVTGWRSTSLRASRRG